MALDPADMPPPEGWTLVVALCRIFGTKRVREVATAAAEFAALRDDLLGPDGAAPPFGLGDIDSKDQEDLVEAAGAAKELRLALFRDFKKVMKSGPYEARGCPLRPGEPPSLPRQVIDPAIWDLIDDFSLRDELFGSRDNRTRQRRFTYTLVEVHARLAPDETSARSTGSPPVPAVDPTSSSPRGRPRLPPGKSRPEIIAAALIKIYLSGKADEYSSNFLLTSLLEEVGIKENPNDNRTFQYGKSIAKAYMEELRRNGPVFTPSSDDPPA